MDFVNPIELLGLDDSDVSDIDTNALKKAKRKLQAEIDLSDNGVVTYQGTELNGSDVEGAISKLDHAENIEFYHFIANNHALNRFLATGDQKIFDSFTQESIYKIPSFISLISPVFAYRYDKSLLDAYQSNNINHLKKIFSLSPLVNDKDREAAYKSIANFIRQKIKEVETISSKIKSDEDDYNEADIVRLIQSIKQKLSSILINALPNQFQPLRNQAALSVRNLSVSVFNTLNLSSAALELIAYSLEFQTDGITKQNLKDDYYQLKEIDDEREEQKRLEPALQKYAKLFVEVKLKIEGVYKKTESAHTILTWINSNFSTTEINSLDSALAEIRNQLALGLRALSIAVWNTYNDANIANSIIIKANAIDVDAATKPTITEAKNQIADIKRRVELANKQRTQARQPASQDSHYQTRKNQSEQSSGVYLLLVVVLVIIIIIVVSNCSKSKNSYSSYNYPSKDYSSQTYSTTPSSNHSSYSASSQTVSEPLPEPIKESRYKGNQLNNGASPLDDCFGAGEYEGQAYITFKNSNNTDAIVCLVNVGTGKTIRNEYIQAGSNYTMKRIPTGTYYLKILYGNDWNPTLKNFCSVLGNFESDVHFSKSDNNSDYIKVENASDYYTTGEITLYTVANGNMQQESMSESEFFK